MKTWHRSPLAALCWMAAVAAGPPIHPGPYSDRIFSTLVEPHRATTLDNAQWGDEFNLPYANGTVYCATVYQGYLVVGGDFTCIGGKPISYLARWDGTEWTPLGLGIDGGARTLLEDGPRLLVGGLFHHAGGLDQAGLAAWDGVSWTAVAPVSLVESAGDFLGVFAMQKFQGDLIVGGEFRSGSRRGVEGIARLQAGEWQAVGGGIHGRVVALAVFRDTLYAGGDFDSAGSAAAEDIARLDGSHWSDIGGITYGDVTALAAYQDRLYVGGYFSRAGGVDISCLAAWDGSSWSAPVGPTEYLSGVYSLLAESDRLDIGHYWGVDFWDGTTLTYGPLLLGGTGALLRQGGDLIVGGSFTTTGTSAVIKIGRWDGVQTWGFTAWTSSSNGFLTELGDGGGPQQLVSYQGKLITLGGVWAGGGGVTLWYYGTPGGLQEATQLLSWDGAAWTPIDFNTTPFNGIPTSMVTDGVALYVAGNFGERAEPGRHIPVLSFDGQSWSGLEGLSAAVSVMTLADGVLYASTYVAEPDLPHVYRWSGGAWEDIGEVQGQGTACGSVLGTLGEYQGKLVAIGHFTSIAGIPAAGAAAWDGSQWEPMGAGTRNCFRSDITASTAQFQGLLVVPTYSCDCSSGETVLEAWDGHTWGTIDGEHRWITALATAKDKLYVSGWTKTSIWNGLRWEDLEPGPNGQVLSIVPHGDDVYFAGDFSSVGAKGSFGIARLIGVNGAPPTEKVWLSSAAPNPSSTWSDFSIHLNHTGSVRVAVHDVRGRQIAVLHDGDMTAGYHAVRWDGRDRAGRSTPAGIYFISAQSPEGTATAKIVRVK
jgi:trimeric autotransporter adhesin